MDSQGNLQACANCHLQAVPWTTTLASGAAAGGGYAAGATPAVFEWAAARGWLLAAGGTTPCIVHTWDLHQEKKHSQVHLQTQTQTQDQVPSIMQVTWHQATRDDVS